MREDNIVVIGDLHIREDEPFFTSSKKFFEWFCESEYNDGRPIIFTGDIVHKPIVNGKVMRFILDVFQDKLKAEHMWIVTGNHDFSRQKGSFLETFEGETTDRVTVVSVPEELKIGEVSFFLLPYFYPNSIPDYSTMKEVYGNLIVNSDYIIGHFSDETSPLFMDADVSHMKGKRLFGHVHVGSAHYVGTPYITRKDESGKDSWIINIDTQRREDQRINVPVCLEYMDVEYGDPIEEQTDYPVIYSVKNAPTKAAAEEMYSDFYLGTIQVKSNFDRTLSKEKSDGKIRPIMEYFEEFVAKNDVSKSVQEKIRGVL